MRFDLENVVKELTQKRWLAALLMIGFLGDMWLGARAAEPRFEVPSAVARAVWLEGGHPLALRALGASGPPSFLKWSQILKQGRGLQAETDWLGSFPARIEFEINADEPMAYKISASRIELGTQIAAGNGQIAKAFAKSWLLQILDPSARTQLRMEVLSDVLSALMTQTRELSLPGSGHQLSWTLAKRSWLEQIRTYAKSCGEDWLPFEMTTFCGGSEWINPLSLRPMLTSSLLSALDRVPPLERFDYAAAWIKRLSDPRRFPPTSIVLDKGVDDLRRGLRSELVSLRGADDLAPEFKALDLDSETPRLDLVEIDGSGRAVLASGLKLNGSDLQTKFIVSDSASRSGEDCRVPTVSEILKRSRYAQRILYVPCAETGLSSLALGDLASWGVEIFAKENRGVPFVVFNRDALVLAVQRRLVAGSTPLSNFIEASHRFSPLLGLNSARWQAGAGAYKVTGAVEAVEWLRLPTPKLAANMTPKR